MGIKLPETGSRKRLVVALCLLLSFRIFGMELEVLPETLITGRVITVKIKTLVPYDESIEAGEIELPQELALISGPVIQPYYARVDGRNQRFHQITWALKSRDSGIFNIPPVEVTTAEETVVLEVPMLKVFNSDEIYNNYPLKVTWNQDIKREIYVGESLPLIVEAYNLEEINFPTRVVSTKPRRGESVEATGLGDIKPELIGESDLYRVPMASWIYTPTEAGRVTIPSVRVDINGLTRYTDSLNLDVLPLPAVNATGGVGEFIISSQLSESQVTPEDLFHFKVRVTGQGNLPYIEFPTVEYSGLILIEKKESSQIDTGDKGFIGWREMDYTLQALEPGVKEISLSEVSWIDNSGNEVFYNGSFTHINIVSVKVIEEDILPFLTFMKTPEILSSYTVKLYKKSLMWLLLGLSALLSIFNSLFRVIKKAREKKALLITITAVSVLIFSSSVFAKGFEYQGQLVSADNFIEDGDFRSALTIYDTIGEKLPNNYGIFVNKAIIWDKLGNNSRAVYNIRVAERIVPLNRKVALIKEYLSESEEYSQKQAKTVNRINPDYIFILLIVFFNILVFSIIRLIKQRNISTYSAVFMALLFTMVSVILLILVDIKNGVEAGIISEGGAVLTKVPNENALEWMTLEEGSCVYIKANWDGDYLIETEYGLQGWISKESILVLEER